MFQHFKQLAPRYRTNFLPGQTIEFFLVWANSSSAVIQLLQSRPIILRTLMKENNSI